MNHYRIDYQIVNLISQGVCLNRTDNPYCHGKHMKLMGYAVKYNLVSEVVFLLFMTIFNKIYCKNDGVSVRALICIGLYDNTTNQCTKLCHYCF